MSTVAARGLMRDSAHAVLGGVCAGVGRRLGIGPALPRAVVVAATVLGGLGAVAYALAWALLPADGAAPAHPGRWKVASGAALLALAALLLLREWGLWTSDAITWPVVLAVAGAILLWWRPGAAPARRGPSGEPQRQPRPRRWAEGSAAWFGIALVAAAGLLFLWANGVLAPAGDVLLTVLVVVFAVALVLSPYWWRIARRAASERDGRVRAEERAEVGAHLHDSVLQTLSMIQKRAEDPGAVAALARQQERDLRAWLAGRPVGGDATLAAALQSAASEIELAHGGRVEVVAVGDAPLDDSGRALLGAAREAMLNAAKFAPGTAVDVYLEAAGEDLAVFVRDRGPGFDPAAVPPDRAGLRESIVGRMTRAGGRAQVHSGPGTGTEVELRISAARRPS